MMRHLHATSFRFVPRRTCPPYPQTDGPLVRILCDGPACQDHLILTPSDFARAETRLKNVPLDGEGGRPRGTKEVGAGGGRERERSLLLGAGCQPGGT
ncbi:hypothetical protein KM043_005359 [Ampulex compressa]|nr:hypothetical protein KM043_005359 [Ampulex compressa]